MSKTPDFRWEGPSWLSKSNKSSKQPAIEPLLESQNLLEKLLKVPLIQPLHLNYYSLENIRLGKYIST